MGMRTTVTLADDVSAQVNRLRRERGIGVSEAINELVREGMTTEQPRTSYVHRSVDLGMRLDVSNVGEVLELLDAPGE